MKKLFLDQPSHFQAGSAGNGDRRHAGFRARHRRHRRCALHCRLFRQASQEHHGRSGQSSHHHLLQTDDAGAIGAASGLRGLLRSYLHRAYCQRGLPHAF